MHRTLHPGSVTDQSVRLHSCRTYVLSDSLLPVPSLSGRSERASVITYFRACTQNPSPGLFPVRSAGFGFFYPAAFEVLERNLLVLTGPTEHNSLPHVRVKHSRFISDHRDAAAIDFWLGPHLPDGTLTPLSSVTSPAVYKAIVFDTFHDKAFSHSASVTNTDNRLLAKTVA